MERRRFDREGEGSRELGLLREPIDPTGDKDRGVAGARGPREAAEVAGERGREAG